MVQRKAPQKIVPQAETKRSHDSRTKGGGGGGGDDLKKKKKMMKLERSIRAVDLDSLHGSSPPIKPKKRLTPLKTSPNYMKPTTSSDARKEKQLPVTTLLPKTTTDKKRNPSSSSSSSSSSSPPPPPPKPLIRQSSLKAIKRSLVKNLKGVVVNRATCSSTLKDSQFPQVLDLNPGGTEAEGISMIRVCPFTYCSLNGHKHEPLPPLRCFVSARRKLIKTQKSMKLKGHPSFRVKALGKEKKEVDTGQEANSAAREDVHDDFFVEIYTSRPDEEIIDEMKNQTECETEEFQVKECEDCDKGVESEGEEDDRMKETCADGIVEDDQDQSSEISNEEMDHVMMSFLEYVEGAEEENKPSLVTEDYGESYANESGKASEDMAGKENKASTFDFDWEEELKSLFPDNMTECSECPDDGFDHNELSIEQTVLFNASIVVEAYGELAREVNHEAPNGGNLESNGIESHGVEICRDDVMNQASELHEEESSEENNPVDTSDISCTKENISDDSFQGSEEAVSEETEEGSDESGTLKLDGSEEMQHLLKEMEENDNEEDEDINSSDHDTEDFDQCITQEDDIYSQQDIQLYSSDGENEVSEVNVREGNMVRSKARTRTRTRKKATDEVDETREFNPRAPNFLDEEPDPDAEKVDLRHQMMDERKNSEEWMIDYALRRAVTQLAPARKKKVALIVEAFETVMPLPEREKPVRDGASGFVHARIMQACS